MVVHDGVVNAEISSLFHLACCCRCGASSNKCRPRHPDYFLCLLPFSYDVLESDYSTASLQQ